MKIEDILTLARAGFDAATIQQLMRADKQPDTKAAADVPVPTNTNPPAAVSDALPAAGSPILPSPEQGGGASLPAAPAGMEEIVAMMRTMQADINSLRTPTAGSMGNPTPVTSIDDIILGAVNRGNPPKAAAENINPYVNKGGQK